MNRNIKAVISIMLSVVAIVSLFAACADKPIEEETSTSVPTVSQQETETTAPSTTEPTTTTTTETTTKVTTTKKETTTKPKKPLKQYPITILVNKDNPIPDDYKKDVVSIGNGHKIDRRAKSDFDEMISAAKKAGYSPIVRSSSRTNDYQKKLYENRVKRFMNEEGCSKKEAKEKASWWVAIPGTSEHEMGLALDIVSSENQTLDSSQEKTKCQKWLMENSWQYGFILRYPKDKTEITKISYEPWHYRYVGKDVAKELHESGMCLEEYFS